MEKYLDIEGLKTLLVRLKEQLDTKANTSKLELYTTIDRLNETLTTYVKTTEMNTALASKVDKVSGKGLSSNDYTAAEKNKLATLENYDDSVLVAQVEALEQSLNTLVGNNASEAIDNFNEILRFLAGITDTQTLEGMLANIREEMQTYLASKVDKVSGKQLSTNDYTTEEKTKLSGIEEGAQVNSITGVKGDSEVNYRTGNVSISKANIGLVNVDNTSDINKPISVATQGALDNKVDKVTGKGLSANDYTTEEKNKLAGIAAGAQVNSITGVKGNAETSYRTGNINITPANIGAATTAVATTSSNGLMSSTDKSKLDGVSANANNYNLPTATDTTLGGVKTGSNITNTSGTISLTKANVTAALGYTPPTQDTTYGTATQSSNGLMSSTDKTKLDGIETGAQKNTVTGIKGNAESSYRTGNVNLTPANIGAAAANHTHAINEVTDLQSTLNGKAAASHVHSANDITSGTLPVERIADGSITSAKLDSGISLPFSLLNGYVIGAISYGIFDESTAPVYNEPSEPVPYGIVCIIVAVNAQRYSGRSYCYLKIGNTTYETSCYANSSGSTIINVKFLLRPANSMEWIEIGTND